MRPIRLLPFLLATALAACVSLPTPSPTLAVGAVQGSGNRSPWQGRDVTVEGIVTADFRGGLGLLALQGTPDGDPATSDAVFVAGVPAGFGEGAHLRVRGRVEERDGGRDARVTVIDAAEVRALRPVAQPSPVLLQALPADAAAWESLEAMRVRVAQPVIVVGHHNAARFGEWQVALGERLWTPTEVALPGADANELGRRNRARMLLLDDGDGRERAGTPMSLDIPRAGSVLEQVEGIVDERHGRYRLQMTAPLQPRPVQRPAAPARAGEVRIVAINLQNLFNGDGRGGGFPTARGARTHADYLRQRAKLVTALSALDADAVALMELENDAAGPLASEAQLVDALNAAHGGDWHAVPMPRTANTDAIRVGLIYRASRLEAVGGPRALDAGPFASHSRPPLAQTFRAGTGSPFTLVANHFKSKGCREAKGADADRRDGQSCWNAMRLDAAQRLDGWLRNAPGGLGAVLLLGDLNAYAMEDPLRWLREAGWQDAFVRNGTTPVYSYVYEGQAGRLDHALLSPALAPRLQAAQVWHINADEPDIADPPGAAPTPWRSSDHDPLVIDLRLRSQ